MGVTPGPGVQASGKSPYANDLANGVLQGTLAAAGPSKPFVFYGTLNLAIWVEFTTTLTTVVDDLSATVAAAGAIAAGASIKCASLVPEGTTVQSIVGTALELALPTRTMTGDVVNGVPAIDDLVDTDWLISSVVSGYGLAGTETVTAITTAAIRNTGAPNVPGKVALSANPSATPVNVNPRNPYEFALVADCIANGAASAIFTGAAIGLTGVIQLERSFDGGLTWLVCNIGGSGALAQWNTTSPIQIAFGEPEKGVVYRLNLASLSAVAGNALNYRLSATGQVGTTLAVQTL